MKLGVIGYGKRIRNMIKTMQELDSGCQISAITDIRVEEIKQMFSEEEASKIQFYEQPEAMLKQNKLDGILIGTRCNIHTELACKVLSLSDIPLFLEKPVAITLEQAQQLKEAYENSGNKKVVVSFPLRVTPIVNCVKEIIDSGKLGKVEHVQAWNDAYYGGVYFHDYAYRDESITGGLFLQKATHDLDYINYLIGYKPVKICAMTSKQVMKGNKPAGLKCVDCDEKKTCPESRAHLGRHSHVAYCCFAEDTGNEDSGSAIIKYDTGMHVSYSQNFLVRRSYTGRRGARFIGYKGTVEFDFHTKLVKVFMHHTNRTETYRIEAESGHHGGDEVLAQNFIDVMKNEAESLSTLEDGLISAWMCIKAKESSETETFKEI